MLEVIQYMMILASIYHSLSIGQTLILQSLIGMYIILTMWSIGTMRMV